MWNEPTTQELEALPRLYETEAQDLEDKVIGMHFFLGGCDWYAAEYSGEDRLFFGYAILNNDFQNAEWGYFHLDELRDLKIRGVYEVDRDLYWEPKRAGDVDRIMKRG